MSTCPICRNDVVHFEEHHFWPREYNGTDMGTISICSTCHAGLHLSANQRYKGNYNKDAFTKDALARAEPFIEIILMARQIHEATNAPNELKKMIIELPALKLAELHKIKVERGYKSMNRFMNDLIDRMIKLR